MGCKLFKPSDGDIQWKVMSHDGLRDILRKAGISCPIGERDPWYWYTDPDTWVNWILEAHALEPSYRSITPTQRGYDCDKFARFLCAHVAAKYLCNGCFEVWGMYAGESHAWNIILTTEGAFEVEPQAGDIWPLGTNPAYQIKTAFLVVCPI